MSYAASVIVSTYNQPVYLDLVLRSFRVQRRRDFEIVVADDGSGPETESVVRAHQTERVLPISHVWQEDEGFRKGMALNRAVRAAEGAYLIFNDGDCIAHPEFVEGHLGCATPGTFLVGRTPRLSRRLTEKIDGPRVDAGRAQRMDLEKILDGLFGRSKKIEFGFFVRNPRVFGFLQRRKKKLGLWGGNFSCAKQDFVRVNGFNEEFVGWGQEDMDLGVRLLNLGLWPVSVANRAINFHLWHPIAKGRGHRATAHRDVKRAYEASGQYYCPLGYDRH